jgi:hypothetical protein
MNESTLSAWWLPHVAHTLLAERAEKVCQDFPGAILYDITVRNDDSIEMPSVDLVEEFRERFAILDRARSLQLMGETETLVALGLGGEPGDELADAALVAAVVILNQVRNDQGPRCLVQEDTLVEKRSANHGRLIEVRGPAWLDGDTHDPIDTKPRLLRRYSSGDMNLCPWIGVRPITDPRAVSVIGGD